MIEAGSLSIDFGAINWLAVVAATIFAMAFGMLYYMPFAVGNVWMDALGTTAEEINARGGHVRAFAVATIGALLSVTTVAILVQLTGADAFISGLLIGALAAVGLVLAPMATAYIFEGRPLKLYIINAAENFVSLIVIALILTLWQ
ncbi:MAG: DUF1761 domain-containing protein [Chloroflexi bacterium]|nr:DUF1761 domain-containing protein [Chloroflexota bacterium]